MDTSAPSAWTTAVTVKFIELLPDDVETTMLATPAGTFAGTVVVMVVEVIPVMFAVTPPMLTPAPVNPDPVMVKAVPICPERGDTVLITGAGVADGAVTAKAKVKSGAMPVVTVMPALLLGRILGTFTTICVLLLVKTVALTPPILTWAPLKLRPLIVMVSFGAPLPGDTLLMVGGDVDGGATTDVVPHPPVLMLRAPPLYVTVTAFAAVQLTPLTVMGCCAPHTVAMRQPDAIAEAARIRILEIMLMICSFRG